MTRKQQQTFITYLPVFIVLILGCLSVGIFLFTNNKSLTDLAQDSAQLSQTFAEEGRYTVHFPSNWKASARDKTDERSFEDSCEILKPLDESRKYNITFCGPYQTSAAYLADKAMATEILGLPTGVATATKQILEFDGREAIEVDQVLSDGSHQVHLFVENVKGPRFPQELEFDESEHEDEAERERESEMSDEEERAWEHERDQEREEEEEEREAITAPGTMDITLYVDKETYNSQQNEAKAIFNRIMSTLDLVD